MSEHTHFEHTRDSWQIDGAFWSKIRNIILFALLISWLGVIAGFFMDSERFYSSYLVGFLSITIVPLGCLFFVMVMYLTGSAWSVTMRRFFETIMVTIPVGALLFLPVLFGMHHLFEWSHTDVVAKDELLLGKSPWLNETGFIVRAGIYFLIWSVLAIRIYTNSTRQDKTHSLKYMDSTSRWSAPGLLVAFLSVSFASFDWAMSLSPHWFSTIFGIYFYAGGGLSCMAVVTLLCVWFRKNGILEKSITIEHYHDLGKWMFALIIFWTYIAFSQYMLIWYANLPEETFFYQDRLVGSWKWVSLSLIIGHFIIPFFVLIRREAKRNLKVLTFSAIWLLVFCYIDLYWLVMPNFNKQGVVIHWLDFVCWAAVLSTYAFVFWARIKNHALVPEGDARLEQSLAHVNI